MAGWIKLHRKISENKLWTSEPFTRGQAWVDLILLANHEYGYFYVRDHKIEVQRGYVGLSQLKIAERWKWSRTKLRKFLKDLEKEQQVRQRISKSYTVIEIINYEIYQQKEQQLIQQENNRKTTEKQQKNTNKKNKEEKEEKEYKKIFLSDLKKSDVPNSEHFEITIAFYELFKKNLIEVGGSTTTLEKAKGTWIDDIRLLIEVDKQNINSVRTVFKYLQHDAFWKKNILSAKTLRKQFNKLLLNANSNGNGNTKKQPATSDQELIEILSKHFD